MWNYQFYICEIYLFFYCFLCWFNFLFRIIIIITLVLGWLPWKTFRTPCIKYFLSVVFKARSYRTYCCLVHVCLKNLAFWSLTKPDVSFLIAQFTHWLVAFLRVNNASCPVVNHMSKLTVPFTQLESPKDKIHPKHSPGA